LLKRGTGDEQPPAADVGCSTGTPRDGSISRESDREEPPATEAELARTRSGS
jgi:hypothetical protein